ncbi:MAG: alanine--tRNA ligase-related protein [Verrucomicrobia subdivision 3 bacterium]|nr:alanine--tRNA ligase-related protein [Limisphaerales bacterium]
MTSSEIRQSFLDFFRSKQHTIVPSSSLMPDAPNLLFTNAGMNQFVPIFLGERAPDVTRWPGAELGIDIHAPDPQKCPVCGADTHGARYHADRRATDTQKCIRAGGKHNDLEDVGLDTYHHTFFEMLGNWSFGDYFKKEAIEWAWELVTEVWKFPKQRLYATVYKPDKATNDPSELDQEAYDHWARLFTAAGLDPKVHIIYGNKKDNFWMMGETGPCGPCSELHVDLTAVGDTNGSLVNKGDGRCIEIWNLVFIQFNANPEGSFSPLPARHVDTGMGFERVTSIIQCTKNFTDFANAKISNYETDIFRPIFAKLEQLSGKKYGSTLPESTAGSATVPVAPVGVPPTGSSTSVPEGTSRVSGSVARDAQQSDRDGRAPQTISQAGYYKRRLPHFERPWAKYMVSFSTHQRRALSPQARDIVLKSLLFGHERLRYQLYAACVMPDHVHFLLEPQIKEYDKENKPVFWPLPELLHSIKSFAAHEINKLEKTSGQLWENESFDRMIRGDADLEEKFHYICRNPWDAGVVPMTENYRWLWTPDVPASGMEPVGGTPTGATGTVALPVPQSSADAARSSAGSVPRDAQQSDRDGRAPHLQIQIDIAFRVIADHIRTLSFAIADGIQPGNTDRNYVLRRILRRAVRYGRTLGFHEPFFYKLVEVLAETMGQVFPEIREKQKQVEEVIRIEEEAFNKTLDRGIELFERAVQQINNPVLPVSGMTLVESKVSEIEVLPDGTMRQETYGVRKGGADRVIDGSFAFKLYDTYGFPLDLTELMARERGLTVDIAGFNKLMDEQRQRARKAQKKQVVEISQLETSTPTRFLGYERIETTAKVVEVVAVKDKTAVVLDHSAAYAESGGQVGDTGELSHGGQLWRIVNTQKTGNTWLHFLADKDAPTVGTEVELTVDKPRREAIQRHHTVTHLLHWALHEVVSRDASQKGSYVGPEKLTFDFNNAPLTPQQVADVEKLVNERILENASVSWSEVPYAEIKSRKDVMQFFGEKYGDTVRVVQIGGKPKALDGYSMELCGGTHTRATGEIGLFRIVGESAIAAGVRRIEAVAGLEAYNLANQQLQLIKSVSGKVNSPVNELEKKIESLLAQQKELEKQLKSMQQKQAAESARGLIAKAQTIGSTRAIIENLGPADGDYLQTVADALKGQFKGVVVLGGVANNAVSLIATVSPELTSKVQAGKIIQAIAPIVGGKGGGKPDNARGGGKEASKLDEALAKVRDLIPS